MDSLIYSYICPPKDTMLYTTSSHDVTGHNDDGFDGTYSYLYHDNGDVSTPVLFEVNGPGAINLIRTGGFCDGELLIYINGDISPTMIWEFDDLYGGLIEDIPQDQVCREKPGHGSAWAYINLTFEDGCRLVARKVSGEYKFFNIFATRGKDSKLIAKGLTLPVPQTMTNRTEATLAGKSRAIVLAREGEGLITCLTLELPVREQIDEALRYLHVRAFWEGESAAAVDAPIGLFFGVGYTGLDGISHQPYELKGRTGSMFIPTGRCAPKTPYFGETKEGSYYCNFPMPFSHAAKIEIINRSHREILFKTEIKTAIQSPQAGFGHFHAIHHAEVNLLAGRDHIVLAVRGSGYYLGGVFRMCGKWYDPTLKKVQRCHLEGDSHFYVDDAKGFLCAGTGTEEYFNWGWYDTIGEKWPGEDTPFTFPTHGYSEHVVDTEDCSTMYRLHHLDPVPFHSAFTYGLEHGPDGREPCDYESVAFCYLNMSESMKLFTYVDLRNPATTSSTHYRESGFTHYASCRVWEGNDQVTVNETAKAGLDWLAINGETFTVSVVKGEASFMATIPEGYKRLVIRRQYDGAWTEGYRSGEPDNAKILCEQSADVFVNGRDCGTWKLPHRHARDCWMQDEFTVLRESFANETDLTITIKNSGNPGWNACAYWLFGE